MIKSQSSFTSRADIIGKRIPELSLVPACVLTNVVWAGENWIKVGHSASISEEFKCQYSILEASKEVDGKAGVEPDG